MRKLAIGEVDGDGETCRDLPREAEELGTEAQAAVDVADRMWLEGNKLLMLQVKGLYK